MITDKLININWTQVDPIETNHINLMDYQRVLVGPRTVGLYLVQPLHNHESAGLVAQGVFVDLDTDLEIAYPSPSILSLQALTYFDIIANEIGANMVGMPFGKGFVQLETLSFPTRRFTAFTASMLMKYKFIHFPFLRRL